MNQNKWMYTGDIAVYLHSKQFGFRINKPSTVEIAVARNYANRFENSLGKNGYFPNTTKSSRKFIHFVKKGHRPITLYLINGTLNRMSYNKTPIESLTSLVRKKPSLQRVLNYRTQLLNKLNTSLD